MDFFGPAHGWPPIRGGGGGKKVPPLKKLSLISDIDETWHSYTLPKEDPKHKSRDTPCEFC